MLSPGWADILRDSTRRRSLHFRDHHAAGSAGGTLPCLDLIRRLSVLAIALAAIACGVTSEGGGALAVIDRRSARCVDVVIDGGSSARSTVTRESAGSPSLDADAAEGDTEDVIDRESDGGRAAEAGDSLEPEVVGRAVDGGGTEDAGAAEDLWDRVLESRVSAAGLVSYHQLTLDGEDLRDVISAMANAEPESMERDDAVAFWINAHNALAIHAVLSGANPGTAEGRLRLYRWHRLTIARARMTLEEVIRRIDPFGSADPRIYFALSNATRGAPPSPVRPIAAPASTRPWPVLPPGSYEAPRETRLTTLVFVSSSHACFRGIAERSSGPAARSRDTSRFTSVTRRWHREFSERPGRSSSGSSIGPSTRRLWRLPPDSAVVDLSIVIPARNEARMIEGVLRGLREAGVCEVVVVVDGESPNETAEIARPMVDRVLRSEPGRARQMNAGAAVTRGEGIFFLHADTRVPPGFAAAILTALEDPRVVGGRFDVELDAEGFTFRVISGMINLRSRWTRLFTGDQGIFIRRSAFDRLGGFPEIALLEDLALSTKMKRAGEIASLRARVRTSARRWQEDGVGRTVALMWGIRALYWFGVSPARLTRFYRAGRSS